MPLWSNEEWRARIGSSWCAIGRPIVHRGGESAAGTQQLQSLGTELQVTSMATMMTLIAIIMEIEKAKKFIMGVVQGIGIHYSVYVLN